MARDPFDELYDPAAHSIGGTRKRKTPELDEIEEAEFEDEENYE